jgi:cobalt-zinc-cadmium efflux system membrane fusion protein
MIPSSPRTTARYSVSIADAALAAAMVAAALLAGCHREQSTSADTTVRIEGERITLPPDMRIEGLRIEPVQAPAAATVQLPARLVWNEDQTARVYSPLQGHVVKLSAQVGDRVKANQALAVLSAPDLGQAQAEWQRAVADLEQAKRTLERQRELYENEVIAQKDYQIADAEYRRAQAERSRTEARLHLYEASGLSVDQTYMLRSPIAGTVVERNVTPGLEVRPDQAGGPLFVVSDASSLWVQIDAREEHLGYVRPGTEFVIRYSAADAEARGKITLVADQVDPASRTIKLRGHVANPEHRLKADAFVTAVFTVPAGAQPRVPSTAAFLHGDQTYVFVASSDREFHRRRIVVGADQGGWLPVQDGLREGERVVTEGNLHLQRLLPNAPPAQPVRGSTAGKSS